MCGHQFHNHRVQILHTFTLITYHPEKYVIAMVLVLQNIKVVVNWSICCDYRTIYSVLSIIADFLFLCNTLVQHILSKVYWWGDNTNQNSRDCSDHGHLISKINWVSVSQLLARVDS